VARRRKLVLAVIDAMKPVMLERAIASGRAPALGLLMERGFHVGNCVAAFPSVTPVCAATIATGTAPDRHLIPSMNWYHRGEARYVEYGTSFRATQAFGFKRSLTDTIYNMNAEHLSPDTPTLFETLDDAGIRTAGTTYLMYRGRHRHEVTSETALTRIASTVFKQPVQGPREFFYADLFASRRTGCRSQLGLPGVRDQHAGCVGAYMVEHDLFDFLLLSLPDNDTHSHKHGPDAQVTSLVAADQQLERLMHAAGGPDEFLEDHAVIVCSDHSQSEVEDEIDLFRAFDGFGVLPASGVRQTKDGAAEIAVCPSSRAAHVYVLDRDARRRVVRRVVRTLLALEGVDLVMHLTDHPDGEAAVHSRTGELRFAPRGDLIDLRGESWSVDGDRSVLALELRDARVRSERYPDALGRVWSALRCRTAGEVVASARPGWEFLDWGRSHHIGGGSHGSLHANDSFGSLLWCGTGPENVGVREQWTLRDIAPMVLGHFGVTA
jgi:Type I phosphodiesterase / nucleotide pyrophosphatase